jgi:hypothetical protein
LVERCLEDRKLIEEIREYAIKWNGDHLDTFLATMEKGNLIETKVLAAQESLEKRMNAMVNTNLMEMRGKLLDMEVNQS